MKFTVAEETMTERRRDRLRRLNFFMTDERVPESIRRRMGLECTHNLMTGFFKNSKWQVAWYCFKEATRGTYLEANISLRLFWYRRVLRLDQEQIEERFIG